MLFDILCYIQVFLVLVRILFLLILEIDKILFLYLGLSELIIFLHVLKNY